MLCTINNIRCIEMLFVDFVFQLSGWEIIINGDGGCGFSQPTGGLTARVVWPRLRVGGRLAPFHIHHNFMNRGTGWTLAAALSYDDSTVNIIMVIIIIIIIIIIITCYPLSSRECCIVNTVVLQFASSASRMSEHVLHRCLTPASEAGCRRCWKTPEHRLFQVPRQRNRDKVI